MKKKVFGRQLKRDTNERKALFKGLMSSLVMLESIQTTLPKAKSIKGQVEKLVTKAKVRGKESRQFIQPFVSAQAVDKIINDLAVRFAQRNGGYTRIIKMGKRFSDNAAMAVIEWVEKSPELGKEVSKKEKEIKKETPKVVKKEKEIVEAEIVKPKKTLRKKVTKESSEKKGKQVK